ncbi:autotransporter-associated beta strand repeat-containing protein, partial [Thauera sinica]
MTHKNNTHRTRRPSAPIAHPHRLRAFLAGLLVLVLLALGLAPLRSALAAEYTNVSGAISSGPWVWLNDPNVAATAWVGGVYPSTTDDVVLRPAGQFGGMPAEWRNITIVGLAACYNNGGGFQVRANGDYRHYAGYNCNIWGHQGAAVDAYALRVLGNAVIGTDTVQTITAADSGIEPFTVGPSGGAARWRYVTIDGNLDIVRGYLTLYGTGNSTVGGTLTMGGGAATSLTLNGLGLTVGAFNTTGTQAKTIELGTGGTLTVGGTSSFNATTALTGSGTIVLNAGATLTLDTSINNTDINIVLKGGTLKLATGRSYNIGTLSLTANSTIDFGKSNASLRTASLEPGGYTLSVVNWSSSISRLHATAIAGSPARDTAGAAPLNQIPFDVEPAANTKWSSIDDEIFSDLTRYWDGANTSQNGVINGGGATWDAQTRWTNSAGDRNSTWVPGQVAVFQNTGGAVTLSGPKSIGGLHFKVSGYGIGGGTLTLDAYPSVFSADATVNVVVGSTITGSAELRKDGAGTIVLTGASTYTGATSVAAGTLQVGNALAVGSIPNTGATVASGATLAFNRNNAYTYAGAIDGAGAVTKASAGNLTLEGANTYNGGTTVSGGTLTIGGAGGTPGTGGVALSAAGTLLDFTRSTDLGYAGVISGAGAVTKSTADATLTLTGNNTYTGATTVSAGTLQVGNNTTTGSLASGSAVTIASGATLAYYSSSDSTGNALIGNTFAGAGTLRFKGNTTQNQSSYKLSAATHSLSGAVVVESGARLLRDNAGGLGTAPITIASGGQLYLSGASADMTNAVSIAGTGWNEAAGYIGALRVDAGATQSGNVTLTAASSIGTFGGTGTISGVISGGFALTKLRAGTTVLTGANTYTGATTVSLGTLQVGAGTAAGTLGTGAVSIASGATLAFYRSDGGSGYSVPQTISGAGTLSFKGTGTGGQSRYVIEVDNTALTGPAIVETGALVDVMHAKALGTGAVTVQPNATLRIGNLTLANNLSLANGAWNTGAGTFGGLRFADDSTTGVVTGNVQLTADARVGTYATGTIGTISGVISGGFGFTKEGAGTLVLSGANTYTGATTVSGGKLKLGANGALPSASATTVTGTLNLDGKTQSLASLTSTGGTLDLGTNGTLTITGNSSIGAVSGSGTIKVTGGTLTLTSAINSASVHIELAGGTLALGALTHSIGTLTVSADSTLDMNAGTAQLTVATLTPAAGKLLTVSNWTSGTDHFYATAVTGGPAKDVPNTAPLNRVKLGSAPPSATYWATTGSELLAFSGPYTYWDGAASNVTSIEGGTGNWTTAGTNWTTEQGGPNGAFTPNNFAFFDGTAGTVTVSAAQNIGGLIFKTDGYIVNGSTLTGTAAINYLQANPDVTATVGSVLAGNKAYEKAGNGTLILTGNNTYTGATTVSFGTLQVGNNTTAGSLAGASAVSIASGATLAYYSPSVDGGNAAIANTFAGAGTLRFMGNGTSGQSSYKLNAATHTLSGAVQVKSGARLNRDGTGTLGTAPITVEAGGQLLLSGGTMTNALSIAGTGWAHSAGALGALRLAGGAIQSGNVALAANADVGAYGSGDTGTIGGVVSGGFTLTKVGLGTIILGSNNTYTGTTTVSAGKLAVGAGGTTGTLGTGAVSVASGASLEFYRSNGTYTIGSALSGAGTLNLRGTGMPDQSGYVIGTANTLSGAVTVGNGARFIVDHGSAAGTASITVSSGGSLFVRDGVTLANALILAGNGQNETDGNLGALRLRNSSATGAVALAGNTRITTQAVADVGTISGAVSGAYALEKTGAGTLVLSGANGYTGVTTVSAGTLKLGASGTLPAATSATVASGATLNLDGKTQTLAGLTSTSGTLDLGTGGTLTLGGNSSIGAISGSGTIKVTGGTLTLANAISNTSVHIELAGGSLALGANTYSIGTFTISNTATLDMASGAASLTAVTLTPKTGTLLTVNNWTSGTDHFYATAITGAPAKGVTGIAPLDRVKLGSNAASATYWASAGNELLAFSGPFTYWDGAAANSTGVEGGAGTWSSAGTNWTTSTGSPNGAWTAGEVAVFGTTTASVTVNVTAAQSIGGLTFKTDGYTLTGSTLTGAAATTPLVTDPGASATVGSVLAGSNAFKKDGNGVLMLTGANTFSGAMNVAGGVLLVGHASALGTTVGATTVGSGASLGLTGGITVGAEPLTISGVGSGGTGALQNAGGSNTWGGAITLAADSVIDTGTGTLTLSGAIGGAYALTFASAGDTVAGGVIGTGAGTLTKSGAGTLTLNAANTYTGATTVSAGTLKLGINGALASASATTVASGATLNLDGKTQTLASLASSGTLNLGTGGTLTLSGNSSIGTVTGSGTIKVTGGTLTLGTGFTNTNVNIELAGGNLTLGANTYGIGTFTITNDATLDMASGTASLTAATLTPAAGKLLTVTNWTAGTDHLYATAITGAPAKGVTGIAPLDRVKLGSNAASATYWASTGNELLANAGPFTYWDGPAANTTSIETGSGTWDYSTRNWTTSTGSPNGVWTDGNIATFGGSATFTATLNADVTIAGLHNHANYLTIGGTGSLTLGASPTVFSTGSGCAFGSWIEVPVKGTNDLQIGNTKFTIRSVSTYSGNTTFDTCEFVIGNAGSLGSGSYAGAIASGGGLFRYSSSAAQTLSGVISGSGGLTKDTSAASTLTLTGANTYTGATTVSTGTLRVGNGGTTGSIAGDIGVAGGATAEWFRADTTSLAIGNTLSGAGSFGFQMTGLSASTDTIVTSVA